MKKNILLTLAILILCTLLLQAEKTTLNGYAVLNIYDIRGETIVFESNRSNSIFKDINVTFKELKTNDNKIDISTIMQYDKKFKTIPMTETFQDSNISYWLKVNLGKNFPFGRFIYSYGDAGFTQHSIKKSQTLDKFELNGKNHMIFTYTPNIDAEVYYFKLLPKNYRLPFRYITVSTLERFYASKSNDTKVSIILGIILGIIAMASIYNLSLYYYNRDISFLYYAFMQFFMILTLIAISNINIADANSFFSRNLSYEGIINLGSGLFAILFSIYFFDTKKHMPLLHKILQFSIILLSIDIVISFFYISLLIRYYIFPFLVLPLIYIGYKRMIEGYKPALFYFTGWIFLSIAIFVEVFNLHLEKYIYISPLYLGATIEAILFSFSLSYKIQLIQKEKEEQKELLVQQSKLASMGEMIGNIAHQWRQPLTHLGYIIMNIKDAQKHSELTAPYLNKKINEANKQLIFMSETIDDFKDFYKPKKEKKDFSLATATKETLQIIKCTFKDNDIKIKLIIKKDCTLYNYRNEYKQVLLNLITNAKDVLLERATKEAWITITVDKVLITVEDNAGGIEKEIMSHIYEPYFTTKEGTLGIGLYMSKMIVEKNMKGNLTVQNTKNGALFSIIF